MYKTSIIISSIIIVAIIFLVLSFITTCLGFFPFSYARHNRNFDKEMNVAIIDLVEQLISVKYNTHCSETLERIFTEELLEKYSEYHHHLFKNIPFFVNRNYMQSLHGSGDGKWTVIVGMHEGGLMTGYSFYLHVTIVEMASGSYLISSIGEDA